MSENSKSRGCLWALLIVLLCPWLLLAIPVVISMFLGMFGVGLGVMGTTLGFLSVAAAFVMSSLGKLWLLFLLGCSLVLVFLPLVWLGYFLIRLMRGESLPSLRMWLLVILIWLLSVFGAGLACVKAVHNASGMDAIMNNLDENIQSWEYEWTVDSDESNVYGTAFMEEN